MEQKAEGLLFEEIKCVERFFQAVFWANDVQQTRPQDVIFVSK
jgi:hypothetical protein